MSWLPDLRVEDGGLGRAPSQFQEEKTFEDIGIWPIIANAMRVWNMHYPSKVQCDVVPKLLKEPPRSVVVQAQTGTGKTMAFFINIIQRTDYTQNCVQHLILVPTRELARQTVEHMNSFIHKGIAISPGEPYGCEKLTVTVAVPNLVPRGHIIRNQVVVGTPGTVLNLIHTKHLPVDTLKTFIINEADNMLDQQSLGDQSLRIRCEIAHIDQVQLGLFSATYPDYVVQWVRRFAPNATQFTIPVEHVARDNIKQLFMDVRDEQHKFNVVSQLYTVMTVCNSVIFTKTKLSAGKLATKMRDEGHMVSVLHSNMTAEERDSVIDDFRHCQTRVMIATNVLSRGIDVPTLSLVINYDVPLREDGGADFDTYIHRVGRCGRYRRAGVSVGFIENASTWM